MPLTQLGLVSNVNFNLSATNGFGTKTSSGNTSLLFSLGHPDLSVWNQLFSEVYTISASGTQAIDLSSVANIVGESFAFMHTLSMTITTIDGDITLSPGASNGFLWGFGTSTDSWTISKDGLVTVSESLTGGQLVDATHKNILLTNNSLTTSTVKIVIAGKTT